MGQIISNTQNIQITTFIGNTKNGQLYNVNSGRLLKENKYKLYSTSLFKPAVFSLCIPKIPDDNTYICDLYFSNGLITGEGSIYFSVNIVNSSNGTNTTIDTAFMLFKLHYRHVNKSYIQFFVKNRITDEFTIQQGPNPFIELRKIRKKVLITLCYNRHKSEFTIRILNTSIIFTHNVIKYPYDNNENLKMLFDISVYNTIMEFSLIESQTHYLQSI